MSAETAVKIDGSIWARAAALPAVMAVGVGVALAQTTQVAPPATTSTSAPAITQPAVTGAGTSLKLRPGSTPLRTDEDDDNGLGRLLAYGLIILALGAAGMVLARRYSPTKALGRGRNVRVLESTYLGPRMAVHLVQVGGRQLLLSSTREQIRMLADVTGSFDQPGADDDEQEGADAT